MCESLSLKEQGGGVFIYQLLPGIGSGLLLSVTFLAF